MKDTRYLKEYASHLQVLSLWFKAYSKLCELVEFSASYNCSVEISSVLEMLRDVYLNIAKDEYIEVTDDILRKPLSFGQLEQVMIEMQKSFLYIHDAGYSVFCFDMPKIAAIVSAKVERHITVISNNIIKSSIRAIFHFVEKSKQDGKKS